MNKPKICLVMIVKNEHSVMPRCLSALRPHIDSWVIMDTGSTDETVPTIERLMDGVPGKVVYEDFQSFQFNRTKVMREARESYDSDYLLMIDADDTWVVDDGFEWPDLSEGCYNVKHVLGNTSFPRPALTQTSLPWEYRGAAHEYMVCLAPYSAGTLKGAHIQCGNDGHRRVTEGAAKYDRIAGILEKEYEENPKNTRTVFYLAQSYRDGGHKEKAITFYKKRVELEGNREEVWFSLYQIGILLEKLGVDWELPREAYLRAYEYMPSRAEPLWAVANLYRNNHKKHLAKVFASAALATKYPTNGLFVDESVYSWRSLDEYCVASQKIGLQSEAKWAALKLLANPDIVGANRNRIEENFTFSCRVISSIKVRPGMGIAVALATYKPDPRQLREAVESILAQTYEHWNLFIISDGNADPPWAALEGIEDPRIHRLHISLNMGQFPIYDALLHETSSPMFAIQDDDDISKPERFAKLVANMERTGADVVFSDIESESEDDKVYIQPSHPEWLAQNPDQIVHAGSHVGLWKTQSLKRIGGYYGGFDTGADTVVVGLMSRLGRPSFLHERLYRARRRSGDSMTQRPETGMNSEARKAVWNDIYALWDEIKVSDNPIVRAKMLMSAGAKKKNVGRIREIFREVLK